MFRDRICNGVGLQFSSGNLVYCLNRSSVKYATSVIAATILLYFSAGCSKSSDVTVQKDTVFTVRTDTVYSKLIRTERFAGTSSLDCLDGCGVSIDSFAETIVRYYTNDSTHFVVSLPPEHSSRVGKQELHFSVSKGLYGKSDYSVMYLTTHAPNRLE